MTKEGKSHHRKGQHGFSLPEVMLAIGILAFGILAVASMQQSSLMGTSKSSSVTQATTCAVDRMERLLALPYSTWTGAQIPIFTPTEAEVAAFPAFAGAPTDAAVERVSFRVDPGPMANSVQITVRVKPKGMRNDIIFTGIKNLLM